MSQASFSLLGVLGIDYLLFLAFLRNRLFCLGKWKLRPDLCEKTEQPGMASAQAFHSPLSRASAQILEVGLVQGLILGF